MPKVSVILTSYNHGKYIREAIDSVLNQTYADFELIIWDDCSSDDSWRIINNYTDPRVKAYCNDKTIGGGYGINKAILEIALGEYIAIHHSDDVWEPEKLQKQVEFLDDNPELGAVFTNALAIGENSQPLDVGEKHYYSTIFDQPNRTRFEWLNYFFYKGNALCHPSVLIRKLCYCECGVYQYRHGLAQLGDFDMWIRLCLKYEIYVLPEKLVRFRVRANEANTSGSRPESRIRAATEYHQVLKNYLKLSNFRELMAVFPNLSLYCCVEGYEPRFLLAMAALESNTQAYSQLFGIELLFDLIADEKSALKIKTLYGFDYLDLIKITGKQDVFSIELIRKEAEFNQVLNNTYWKMTMPLRRLSAFLLNKTLY